MTIPLNIDRKNGHSIYPRCGGSNAESKLD